MKTVLRRGVEVPAEIAEMMDCAGTSLEQRRLNHRSTMNKTNQKEKMTTG